ncbi:endonuclease III [Eremococcus coleocola]|uniref:Endonuclease III n=1 Tax=Eremococcus coleocola ACS-139-V-Col8 TaxID=908337 RepID=E4KLU5_9LACT|nr:endonuclease III [Eremococcus coleocola]EFR32126.1 endonuclease III [Eremococcus coleocola ACS-139-V-Col8]
MAGTMTQERMARILDQLRLLIEDPVSELNFENPFQLLVAVILSAQTTDKQVNKLTPSLFERFPDAQSLAQASPSQVEPYIKSIGLFHNKAKYLVATGKRLVEDFGGQVPDNRKDLESLPGVGRKTANVVLGQAFGQPAIAVDTHVERVAKAMGVVDQAASPLQVEKALMALIPENQWVEAHHLLLLFGRYYAKANVKDWTQFVDMSQIDIDKKR